MELVNFLAQDFAGYVIGSVAPPSIVGAPHWLSPSSLDANSARNQVTRRLLNRLIDNHFIERTDRGRDTSHHAMNIENST